MGYYKSIAKLGFLLGGVGNRSRRGFGSIRYQNWNFQTAPEIQQKVYQTLDSISPGQFRQNTNEIQVNSTSPFPNYPVIRSIYFGTKLWNDFEDLLNRIGQATHDHNKDGALGYAKNLQRLASPIHVRIQTVGGKYLPIVTQLHSIYTSLVLTKQKDFIDAIIR